MTTEVIFAEVNGTYSRLNSEEGAAFAQARGANIRRFYMDLDQPNLSVWYGKMPESNGKSNWTAILCRDGNICDGYTIARSEYEDRVRYEADCMRFLIGEIDKEPFILDYDEKKHSGYVEPLDEKLIDRMVDRFLKWQLPKNFYPDAGISFTPSDNPCSWPMGTNLLDCNQAREMIKHLLSEEI